MLRISSVKFGYALSGLAISVSLLAGGLMAQDKAPAKTTQAPKPARDPFAPAPWQKRANPKPVVVPKMTPKVAAKPTPPPPSLVKAPEIQDRVNYYKEQKRAYVAEGKMPPKPTTVFLIDEIEVSGIFRTPRGYAAMIHAKPIKLSYVIYPGEKLFDGQLVAIDEDHLVFRHHREWSDGRSEDRVERKSLRQMQADELTAEKNAPGVATPQAAPAATTATPGTAETAQPVLTPEVAPAPKAKTPANFAGELINSLPTRNAEKETSKPANEFSPTPAAAPKSEPAPVKPTGKAAGKGKAAPAKTAKPKNK